MLLKVGNKKLTVRGWKGKDKKAFLKALKDENLKETEVMDALVYACIEENPILTIEEFKYVLSRIRAISLGEDIEIEFYCKECGTLHKEQFLLKDILTYTFTELKEIKTKDVHIKLGEIKNKSIYIKKIAEDPLYDLLLRVESFNGDTAFTLDSLEEKFDDLDLNVLADIIQQYEDAKFKVQDINTVTCPECGDKTDYEFDELPEFFPESWFNE